MQVANTVGLPRLSSTSRPASRSIVGIGFDFVNKLVDQIRNAPRRRGHQLDDDVLLSSHFLWRQVLQPGFSRHSRQQAS
jgi:hypothetical protein